jgi:hypothetical protein
MSVGHSPSQEKADSTSKKMLQQVRSVRSAKDIQQNGVCFYLLKATGFTISTHLLTDTLKVNPQLFITLSSINIFCKYTMAKSRRGSLVTQSDSDMDIQQTVYM